MKTVKYSGEMNVITGLSIQGNDATLKIGGADNPVIRNPIDGMPYIPGSSLKGKLRSLCELKHGAYEWVLENRLGTRNHFGTKKGRKEEVLYRVKNDSILCKCGYDKCLVCNIFGSSDINTKTSPTRIIVRDGTLTDASKRLILERDPEEGNYLEDKTEILMDRKTGSAKKGGLRTMERVPAGLSFNVEIVLQIFDGDNEEEMKEYINNALKMLEDNYLGGSGSRGYGQVKFNGSWT